MAIVIHHIEGRRSERVAWLLEELGVPYELDFIQGDILGSLLALEKHHEMRMTPILTDGDIVIVESSAILEFLLARYGKTSSLRPAEDSPEFAPYLEFLHFAEGTGMQKILADIAAKRLDQVLKKHGEWQEPPKMPGLAGSRTGAQRVVHYAENTLAKRPYLAGNAFTAADIMMHFTLRFGVPVATDTPLSMATLHSIDGPHYEQFPNVHGYLKRITSRPAFQRAMKATMPNGPPAM